MSDATNARSIGMDTDTIRTEVRAGYARVAAATSGEQSGSCCGPGCCAPGSAGVSLKLGYSAEELGALPEGADMGLSCGNPGAIARLKPGEVVLDLGAGGGLDVFLAGPKVGAAGRAIGVDMTPQMLDKARGGLASYRRRTGLDNVEFRLGEIEHIPAADNSVDVVISNCVINLSPDQSRVWREIARVLRPGGRVAVSDIVLHRPLPDAVAGMIDSWVGCVAGARTIADVRAMAQAAGLQDVSITPRPEYVKALESARDPLYTRIVELLPEATTLGDFMTSATIEGVKPGASADA